MGTFLSSSLFIKIKTILKVYESFNKTLAFSLLFSFCPVLFFAQAVATDIKKISDGLWIHSDDLNAAGKYKEALILNQELIKHSQKIEYSEGIVRGYCNIAIILSKLGKYQESFSFVRLAEKENKENSDKGMESVIYSTKGFIYSSLDFQNRSLHYLRKALVMSENIDDKHKREKVRAFTYSHMMYIYENSEKMDSAFYYSKKAFHELNNAYNSSVLAYCYLYYKKDIDSSEYYLQYAGNEIKRKKSSPFERYTLYRFFGELHEQKKDYDSSAYYYHKALQIGKETHLPKLTRDSYWFLCNIAELQNDEKAAAAYLRKYTILSDSISRSQKKQMDFPIQQYIKDSEEAYSLKEDRLKYLIGLVTIIFTLLLLAFIKRNKNKETLFKNTIEEKDEVIMEREMETRQLKDKVKDGFEEVVYLAKKNNPEFLTRFMEVYPDFYQALLKVYPDINSETLKFCALLKLNFSTKDISEYTFVTTRAVQIRKNRLRKKLNISSEENIYVWISQL